MMYRLLSARNLYHSGLQNIITPSNTGVQKTTAVEIKCSFCRKILVGRRNIENLYLVRHQSTKTASALQKSSKKKVKYKVKRYGELLEVNDKSMTEMKVSISKLRADHLSKLTSSSVSLGQLHQLTSKSSNNLPEVDPILLQKVKNKILNKKCHSKDISLEDDKCALIFTTSKISSIEDKFKTKQYIDMVKTSYYNFRKTTLYDQRLQDLRYAINEGLNQEFDLSPVSKSHPNCEELDQNMPRGAHAVFKELFFDTQWDNYDHELMTHITSLQNHSIGHPALEDILDDSDLAGENSYPHGELETSHDASFNVKKAKQAYKAKKKAKREKRLARQQENMKEDIKDMESRGKQEALNKLLASHIQLLCSLNMIAEGGQILQYYRMRRNRGSDQTKITDVRVYNILLHGYAAIGQYKSAAQILSYMHEDNINENAQTYAALFECIERSDIENKDILLNQYRKMMETKGITLNDLLDKSIFQKDQREVVLKAIRSIQPDFNPVYTPPDLDYICPLLKDIKLDQIENRLGLLKSPAEGVLTLEDLKERGRKQLEIEIKGDIEVTNINVKEDNSPTVVLYREKLEECKMVWRQVIKDAFIRNLGTLKSQSNASHSAITLYPYLKVLEVDKIVDLVLGEISRLVDGSETFSPTLKSLQRDLGSQVYQRYQIEEYRRSGVMNKLLEIYDKYCEWYIDRHSVDGSSAPYNGRQVWQMLVHQHREGASLDAPEIPWPMEMRQNVGKFLYNIIINDVKINVNMFKPKAKQKLLPAVYKVHRPWARQVRLELKPHPVLARLWGGGARPALTLRSTLVPLTAPAAPWRTAHCGGYLATAPPLLRLPFNVSQQWKRLEEAPLASLYPVLDGLNQLGEVPWVINKPLLDLQIQIFRAGGNKKLDIPPPPSSLEMDQLGADASKADAFRRRVAMNRARAEMYSLWCDALYKLSLANHYRDDVFWLPHNMDFRGRVYACPPHLSQLGADTARALLMFAKPMPLGPDGFDWLKIHAINLTGTMKKNTIQERLEYANNIIDLIVDSAERPMEGTKWWMQSEEPWQTLACCIEIANASKLPDPAEYQCRFPVHQDGSCNGLQHYAALGGDAGGAAAVNLAPAPKPRDVYSDTAARVEEMRQRDAAQGVLAAQALEGFVRRKVIKQTVMTTVYGVTKFGARLQIAKQLKDIDDFPKEQVWACSQYLTARTFDSLREMFTSTKLIQDWFTDCAKMISGVCGESVEWVTPLGLPVVQPYYRRPPPSAAQYRAPTDLHQRPCTVKQRNAFPPNLIHSLDASHMMLTALRCQAAALLFVSVHDCFWTHPSTVPLMNRICREQFVALHSQPILDDLSKFLVERYSYPDSEIANEAPGSANKKRVNSLLAKVPSKGDFQLENVLRSVYFFS